MLLSIAIVLLALLVPSNAFVQEDRMSVLMQVLHAGVSNNAKKRRRRDSVKHHQYLLFLWNNNTVFSVLLFNTHSLMYVCVSCITVEISLVRNVAK
jgi:UDP-N-acetylmuramyl pentapeptide phosphotransferase/UDP-N-acetylglucosamine-1-phosphate transferase